MAVYTHTPACDDSDWLAWNNAPALAVDGGGDVTLPEITLNTPGDYTLHLMADYRCDEEELVETNNVFTKTITIGPPMLPDLVIAAVTTEPATGIAEGDWVTVTAVVSNTGYIASEEVSLAVYTGLNAPGCGAGNWDNVMTVAPIEAGAAATIVVPGIVFDDQGTQHLYSFIDYNCYGDELDHTNNIDDRTFTILPPLVPDLAIVELHRGYADAVRRGRRQLHASHPEPRDRKGPLDTPGRGSTSTTPARRYAATSETGWRTFRRSRPGRRYTATMFARFTTAGSHTARAFIDYNCAHH